MMSILYLPFLNEENVLFTLYYLQNIFFEKGIQFHFIK